MDEDFEIPDDDDEEFKQMEKDIDEFLSSIREDSKKTYEQQSEASCSGINNDYDCISSDDFDESDFKLLNSKDIGQDILNTSKRKPSNFSSSSKNKHGWRKWNANEHKVYKKAYRRGQHNNTGRGSIQKDLSNPWHEYEEYMKQLSRRKNKKKYRNRFFHCRDEDNYSWSSPRGGDEFDYEWSLSSSESASYHRSDSWSPDGRSRHREDRSDSRGRHRHRRMYDEESNSSDSCSQKQTNEHDYMDSNNYWKHEDDSFTGDVNETTRTVSVITACLERAIATNPEVAQKLSSACMSLLNKSVDKSCDSDFDFDDNVSGRFIDWSDRLSPRSSKDIKSPSWSKSIGSSIGASGSRHHKNRYENTSERTYHSSQNKERDPSPHDRVQKLRCSPDCDKKRTAGSASQTLRMKRRSSSKHLKKEEDPRRTVARSIRKIKKQCGEESDSTVRRALLALSEVHERECEMYLRKPEAHPDYNKEYREFVDKKSKDILDLGGDPNTFDFKLAWKRYWPTQINRLFEESWDAKMLKCTSMLQKRGHVSKSLHAGTEKNVISPPEKKRKISKHGNENKVKEVKSTEKQDKSQTALTKHYSVKEEMDKELLNILRLLNHIKHKFHDCESSFDKFYQRILKLKENNLDLIYIIQDNFSLLKRIDASLKETLEDTNLTLIQKAIIQETHERFKCFLKKSQETNSGLEKNSETVVSLAKITADNNSFQNEGKHQIPSHVTEINPSVITFKKDDLSYCSYGCYDNNKQIGHTVRTLTEISIQGSSCKPSNVQNETNDESLTCKSPTIIKDTDIIQPPPPGVTPPREIDPTSDVIFSPSDVNPTSAGAIFPRSDVNITSSSIISSRSDVNPTSSDVVSPPSDEDPTSTDVVSPLGDINATSTGVISVVSDVNSTSGIISAPSDVNSTSIDVSQPSDVNSTSIDVSQPSDVNSTSIDVSQSSDVNSTSGTISAPSDVNSASTDVKSVSSPSDLNPTSTDIVFPSSDVNPSSGSDVNPASLETTPLGITKASTFPATTTSFIHTNVLSPTVITTSSQNDKSLSSSSISYVNRIALSTKDTSSLAAHGPAVSTYPQRSIHDSQSQNLTSKTVQHLPTISKHSEHKSESIKDNKTVTMLQEETINQSSKEFLQSTIKDCFVNTLSPQGSSETYITEGIGKLDSKVEDNTFSLGPSLSEDILKMFIVKSEDKNKISEESKPNAKINSSENDDINVKAVEKKPIKIKIPQFSKQKSMPNFKPVVDDQDLQ